MINYYLAKSSPSRWNPCGLPGASLCMGISTAIPARLGHRGAGPGSLCPMEPLRFQNLLASSRHCTERPFCAQGSCQQVTAVGDGRERVSLAGAGPSFSGRFVFVEFRVKWVVFITIAVVYHREGSRLRSLPGFTALAAR